MDSVFKGKGTAGGLLVNRKKKKNVWQLPPLSADTLTESTRRPRSPAVSINQSAVWFHYIGLNCVRCTSTCSGGNSGVRPAGGKQKMGTAAGTRGRGDVKAFIHRLLESSLFHATAFPSPQSWEPVCSEKITSGLRAASQTNQHHARCCSLLERAQWDTAYIQFREAGEVHQFMLVCAFLFQWSEKKNNKHWKKFYQDLKTKLKSIFF